MKSKIVSLLFIGIFFVSCHAQEAKNVKIITAADFNEKINSNKNAQIIDVRTPEEYASGHIENAININWYDANFESEVKKLDKTKPVFVYCKVGGRSSKASNKLAEMGYTTIYDLQGGYLKWESAGFTTPSDKIIGICSQEYAELLNTDKKVLINFYAPWCEPCKKMEPYLLQMQKEANQSYTIVRLNADENKTIMKELKIDELPTFLLYKNKEIEWKHTGYISESDLKKQL